MAQNPRTPRNVTMFDSREFYRIGFSDAVVRPLEELFEAVNGGEAGTDRIYELEFGTGTTDSPLSSFATNVGADGVLSIVGGGTGGETAAEARSNLGLEIGSDVLAFDSNLQAFVNAFTLPTSDAAANTPLTTDGSGTLQLGGVIPIANGGTGANTAVSARSNLGLEIGADVLAFDSNLNSFIGLFTLPTADGSAGQALTTDGAGNLEFSALAETLIADRTYHVNTSTGSDSNDGLTAGTAFATLQKAIDARNSLIQSGFTVTISVTGNPQTTDVLGWQLLPGNGPVVLKGTSRAGAIFENTLTNRIFTLVNGSTNWQLLTMTLKGPAGVLSDSAIECEQLSYVIVDDLLFDHEGIHIRASDGSVVRYGSNGFDTNYIAVSGLQFNCHIFAANGGVIRRQVQTTTITGAHTLAGGDAAFARADYGGLLRSNGGSFGGAGSVTGKRYQATNASDIVTNGGGASHFPGTVAGTVDATSSYS